jgi:hypothetical protein
MSNYTESDRQRVLALIAHLKNGGGVNYDNAPQHVFFEKNCPPEYQKSSLEILQEYEELLAEIENALN